MTTIAEVVNAFESALRSEANVRDTLNLAVSATSVARQAIYSFYAEATKPALVPEAPPEAAPDQTVAA